MCLICKDFELGKLTLNEAYRNLKEVYDDEDEHSVDVWMMLLDAELKDGV
jgi:hypothetical protein